MHSADAAVPSAQQADDDVLLRRRQARQGGQPAQKKQGNVEITRFKGLGEISPEEFGQFIGEEMRLESVVMPPDASLDKMLEYYMARTRPAPGHVEQNLRVGSGGRTAKRFFKATKNKITEQGRR